MITTYFYKKVFVHINYKQTTLETLFFYKISFNCILFKTSYQNFTSNNKIDKTQPDNLLKFNNNSLSYESNLKIFLSKNFFGSKYFFISQIESRIEISRLKSFKFYKIDKWLIFSKYINNIVPLNTSIKNKFLINLTFLFLTRTYRGWRHSFSLPSRGQRTWSNAWSVFKTKNIFKDYIFDLFKLGINNAHPDELKNGFYLEQLNCLWKWQWRKEWLKAFFKKKKEFKKIRGVKKLELNTLANSNPNYLKFKKQTVVPIGFEPGFTKKYLKEIKFLLKKK